MFLYSYDEGRLLAWNSWVFPLLNDSCSSADDHCIDSLIGY